MKEFKRVFCVLLSLLLLGTLFPATVFAADAPQIYVAGVGMNDGHYLAQGADEVSTEQPEDRYAYYMDGVLTLHNFSYSGCGTPWDVASYAGIYAPTAVTIRLEGSNSIQAVAGGNADAQHLTGIYCGDQVTVTAASTEHQLTVYGANVGIGGEAGVSLLNGTVQITGVNEKAIHYGSRTLERSLSLTAIASEHPDGSCPVVYSVEDNASYHYFKIGSGLHGHYYGSETQPASYNCDEDYHWMMCMDGECPDIEGSIRFKDTHDYADASDTTCHTCGYVRTTGECVLTVENGEGSGTYPAGTVVDISATVPEGAVFYTWEVLTAGTNVEFTNPTSAETSLTVPGYNLKIRPVFKYYLTVTNGFAGASEVGEGEEVTVMASAPLGCSAFDKWEVTGIELDDPTASTVTLRMPANAVTMKATYREAHYGGTATCKEQAICEACETPYGALAECDYSGTDPNICVVCGESKFYPVYVGSVGLREGMYLANDSSEPTATKPDGGYAHYSAGTLTLNNFAYSGRGYAYGITDHALIYSDEDLVVTLIGLNDLVQPEDVDDADGIVSGGENGVTVNSEGGMLNIYVDDNGMKAPTGDVNIIGCQIYIGDVYNGIDAADDVLVSNAQVEISAYNDGIFARGDFTMSSGLLNISAVDDGINAANASFTGGTANLYSDGWGMYIKGQVLVNGGDVISGGVFRGVYADLGIRVLSGELFAGCMNDEEEDAGAIYFDYELEGSKLEYASSMAVDASMSVNGPMVPFDANKIFQYRLLRIRPAERAKPVYVGVVGLDDGEYLAVGGQEATATKPDGGYAYYNDGVLTLHDFSYNGNGYTIRNGQDNAIIYAQKDLTIRLEGDNSLVEGAMADTLTGIEVAYSCKLTINGTGSLNISVSGIAIYASNEMNASNCDITVEDAEYAIACNGDLTVNGAHIRTSGNNRGIGAGYLILNSGSLDISKAETDALMVIGGATINGGTLTLAGEETGLYAMNGDVVINGGKSNISGGLFGIFVLNNLSFTGGELTVSATGTEAACAIYFENGTFVPDAGTKVQACETLNGTMVDYDPENLLNYMKISAVGASAVSITRQPESVSVKSGVTAATTVEAQGDGLKYAWYFTNNADDTTFSKSSITTATYSTVMDLSRDGRQVYCVITDKYGNSVTTETATLSMEKTPLVITQQPASVTVVSGAAAKTTVKAEGDDLTYTWYFTSGGTATKFSKSSVTSATYSTTMSADRDGRQVYCIVTDAYGQTARTETVTLSMKEAITITAKPQNAKVGNGETAKVTVEAEGEDLTYTWYYANKGKTTFTKSSYNTNTYATIMDSVRDGRRVYCVIKDRYGNSVKTNTVTMYMYTPLAITAQPVDAEVAEGITAKATVEVQGDGLTYKWYYKNADATTFTASSIKTNTYSTKMDAVRDGRQVYCVITDRYGESVTTDTVTLSMKPRTPLAITQQPASVTVGNGDTATATVVAQGDGLTYAWYFTSNKSDKTFSKSSTTTATYSATMDATRDGRKVYCKITDAYGNTVKTETVTLSMEKTPLVITQQPTDVTVAKGAAAKTTVVATGDGLKYAWYFTSNAADTTFSKSSTTTATYSATMDASRDGRKVYCIITDAYGQSVKTETVTLAMEQNSVGTPLKIVTQPTSVTVANGKTAATSVVAQGDGLTYTWYYTSNGTTTKFYKSSTTTATYSTTMDSSRDGRQVYCVITDAYGNTVTSNTVTLKMS